MTSSCAVARVVAGGLAGRDPASVAAGSDCRGRCRCGRCGRDIRSLRTREHIIDPASGQAVRGLASVTVIGPDLAVVDVYVTATMALGPDAGMRWLAECAGDEGFGITDSRAVMLTPGFARLSLVMRIYGETIGIVDPVSMSNPWRPNPRSVTHGSRVDRADGRARRGDVRPSGAPDLPTLDNASTTCWPCSTRRGSTGPPASASRAGPRSRSCSRSRIPIVSNLSGRSRRGRASPSPTTLPSDCRRLCCGGSPPRWAQVGARVRSLTSWDRASPTRRSANGSRQFSSARRAPDKRRRSCNAASTTTCGTCCRSSWFRPWCSTARATGSCPSPWVATSPSASPAWRMVECAGDDNFPFLGDVDVVHGRDRGVPHRRTWLPPYGSRCRHGDVHRHLRLDPAGRRRMRDAEVARAHSKSTTRRCVAS